MNAPLPDLRCEHRTEPVPPETHCFVANIDATFKQQIFDLPKRKRMYIITVRRITSGELLKYRKGFCIAGSYGMPLSGSTDLV